MKVSPQSFSLSARSQQLPLHASLTQLALTLEAQPAPF
jgi:hypothetical protein